MSVSAVSSVNRAQTALGSKQEKQIFYKMIDFIMASLEANVRPSATFYVRRKHGKRGRVYARGYRILDVYQANAERCQGMSCHIG